MLKTFQYRIYPTKKQETKLQRALEECRWLYNRLLTERKIIHDQAGKGLTRFDQIKTLPTLKECRPSLKDVHSQVLQNVSVRVDLAFKAFFRRVKQGTEKPGFPRFKGWNRYDSFTYTQSGFGLTEAGCVSLSKIGDIKIILHRPISGTIKTCTIKRSSTNKWFVSFAVEAEPQRLQTSTIQVGIDVGLKTFAVLSSGEKIKNPRFFKHEEKALVKAQRRKEVLKKRSTKLERRKSRRAIARIHERIRFRRDNFTHQESRKIVNKFGIICVEDLSVNKMIQTKQMSKSISDASWTQFINRLSNKAEEAGRQFVKVNPAYTSQTCSKCHHRQPMPLSKRTFSCECCGIKLCRDHNASLNVLTLGLQGLQLAC